MHEVCLQRRWFASGVTARDRAQESGGEGRKGWEREKGWWFTGADCLRGGCVGGGVGMAGAVDQLREFIKATGMPSVAIEDLSRLPNP